MTTVQLIKKRYTKNINLKRRMKRIYQEQGPKKKQSKNKLIKFIMRNDTAFAGAIGGTATAISYIPPICTISQTFILALIGAVTSITVTLLIKKIWHKFFPKDKL